MSPNVRKPNFFIIGAAKCGTTSLHDYLSQHPEIFLSDPKEPGFFVPEITYYPREEAWYLSLFEEAGVARYVGESSTHYTKRPIWEGVPQRIKAYAPEARFVYLMRDPIRRAVSHYWHNARHFEENRSILAAIRNDIQYRAFGDYAMQLDPWFSIFGRDAVLPLVFEEMISAPEKTIGLVLDWLDLDPLDGEIELGKKNVRPSRVTRPIGPKSISRFRYSTLWSAVSPRMPRRIKELAKRFTTETVDPDQATPQAVVEELRPWARERVGALADLLGRDFDIWELTHGGE